MDVTLDFILELGLYFVIAFGFLTIGLTICVIVIFKDHNLSGESLALIVQRTELAKLATVFLIVLTVTFLGVLKILAAEAVVAVLSGIAGYVLGGKTSKKGDEQSDSS